MLEMESILRNCLTSNVYVMKLRDWYQFNILQRIHLNYVENLSFATTATLAAGLFEPKAAAYTGLVYLLGRYSYLFTLECSMEPITRRSKA